MSIDLKIQDDLKLAMKAGEKEKVETLRTLRAHIKNARIEKGKDLNDEEIIEVLTSASKKAKDSIEMFTKGGRNDLVEKEKFQLQLITNYLPAQLSEEEVVNIVKDVITELGAQSEKDFGRVMAVLMKQLKGRVDGKIVQQKLREALVSPT